MEKEKRLEERKFNIPEKEERGEKQKNPNNAPNFSSKKEALRREEDDFNQDLSSRRQKLADKLNHLEQKIVHPDKKTQSERQGVNKASSQALKISSEFIAGIAIGILLGLAFDKLANTSPWGLIIFLFLGFCAGVLNVLRASGKETGPFFAKTSPFEGLKKYAKKPENKK